MCNFKCFKILLFSCLFTLVSTQMLQAFQSDWQVLEVKEGSDFEVEFPQEPKRQNSEVDSELGPMTMNMLIAEIDKDFVVIASMNSFPPVNLWNAWEVFGQYDVDEGLEGATRGAAENSGSKIIEKTAIEKFGNPGRDILMKHPAGFTMRARFFINDESMELYQAVVVAPDRESAFGEDSERFLNSMNFPERNSTSADWEEFQLGEGKLVVKFPTKPKRIVQTSSTPAGDLNIEMHQLEISPTYAIISSFTKYPAVGEYDVDAGLDGAVRGAAENSNSTIQSTQDISKNGIKGRETYFESPAGLMRARFYIADKKDGPEIYQTIVVASKKSILDDENSTFFLDSLNF